MINRRWKKTREENRLVVDEEEMLQVVAAWTGIPLSKMEEAESKKLLKLEAELQSKVIGQTIAPKLFLRPCRSRADLKDPKRPIGSFMFLDPQVQERHCLQSFG